MASDRYLDRFVKGDLTPPLHVHKFTYPGSWAEHGATSFCIRRDVGKEIEEPSFARLGNVVKKLLKIKFAHKLVTPWYDEKRREAHPRFPCFRIIFLAGAFWRGATVVAIPYCKRPASMFVRTLLVSVFLSLGCTTPLLAGESVVLSLNEGERILFVGNGFVENDLGHAYFETRLQRRFPKQTLTFRYMGWSGDTVRGSARTAGFQVPQGLARLEKEALAQKPTVIFLAYGMNESFDSSLPIPDFLRDYDKLLKTLAPLKARFVIVSPTFHEDLGRPFPDPAEHNQQLQQFTKALKGFAEERKLPFVDLFHSLAFAKMSDPMLRLTTNGLLLTQAGYALTAKALEEQLGFPPHRWQVTLDQTGKTSESAGTKLADVITKNNTLRFQASDAMLPISLDVHKLSITGLSVGDYTLKIDGQNVLNASAADWQRGVDIINGPMFADGEKLRAAIVERNQLFYRRWRPYNDHSRHWGFIGGDYQLYDKEIAEQEQRIAALRAPRLRIYEIAPKAK